MTRALIFLPIWSRVRVSDAPVAPASGAPSAYHWVLAFVGCGAHAAGVSVRVVPTSGAPWIVGSCAFWKVPGATGAVASAACAGGVAAQLGGHLGGQGLALDVGRGHVAGAGGPGDRGTVGEPAVR